MSAALPFTPAGGIARAGGNWSGSNTRVWWPETPRTPEEIARVRFRENDYFRFWRAGRHNEWQAPRTRMFIADLPPRRIGAWSGRFSAARASAVQRRVDNQTTVRRYVSSSKASRASTASEGPPGAVQRPTNAVLARLSGVKLVRYLGYGGEGVACLVEVACRQGGASKAVMKVSLAADDEWGEGNLTDEKRWQLAMKRASHVVQIQRFAVLRGTPNTPEDAKVDQDPHLYFMEVMKSGDLHRVIGRAGNTGEKLPSRLLWKIFACLIRGCIAMRYPPRLRRIISPLQMDWVAEDGPDLPEQVPADPGVSVSRDYNMIHFDLDPKNIFIGDIGDQDHDFTPKFKIADLGLALRTVDESFNSPAVWTLRQRGKADFYLPEQYHKEWEWGSTNPRQQRPPLRVAANFGSWSNIYHIAMCMHMLITLYSFPYPPDAVGPLNSPDLPVKYAGIGPVQDYWNNQVPAFHTNGADLAKEQDLDIRLRNLLMRCLAIIPNDRPSLVELEAWASDVETKPTFFADIGGDLTTSELAGKFIGRPSVPITQTPAPFDTALLAGGMANLSLGSGSLSL